MLIVLTGFYKLPLIHGTYMQGIKNPNLQNYQPGRQPFFWWAFTSTTDIVAATQEFLRTGPRMLFIIDGVGVDISPFSAFPGEQEILFLPGTFLTLKCSMTDAGGLTIVQLVQQPAPPMVDFSHPQLATALAQAQQQRSSFWRIIRVRTLCSS